ncbi:MAG: TIGR03013 family XrtA/PEP-CTERM system glycosyltransferase [Burkholderiales bacterium]
MERAEDPHNKSKESKSVVDLFGRQVRIATFLHACVEGGVFFLLMLLATGMSEQSLSPFALNPMVPAALFSCMLVAVNGVLGVYQPGKQALNGESALRSLTALIIGCAAAYGVFRLLPDGELYQTAIGWTTILGVIAVVTFRKPILSSISRAVTGWLSHRVLVLGTGAGALEVDRTLAAMSGSGIKLIGFYPVSASEPVLVAGNRVLSTKAAVEEIVRTYRVDQVIVAVKEQRGGVLPLRQLLDCRLQGVKVTDLPGFIESIRGAVPIESLKASWLIYGEGFRIGRTRLIVKRLFDLIASAAMLAVMSPVILVTALAIYCESGGPIIFRQERVGRGGQSFWLLKFRSMRTDAEKDGTPQWASPNDPRVTGVGRIIRKVRIDELPQLFNVLKGEMSFVGPRPERPFFVSQLTESIPFYGARHSVNPGVTGWAQVRASYGASEEDSKLKLEYDLYYVKHQTLWLDIVVLAETVRVVLFGEGAR